MMDRVFFGSCLEKCRKNLLEMETDCEDDAYEMIVHTVFSGSGAEGKDDDELDNVIRKIACMTRGKLGILDPLTEDEEISEIMVNGKNDICRSGCKYSLTH